MINNQFAEDAFKTMVVTIGIVTAFLGVIIWFICWIQSGTEETRMKHETCMVETTYFIQDLKPATRIIQYCGPNNEGVTK